MSKEKDLKILHKIGARWKDKPRLGWYFIKDNGKDCQFIGKNSKEATDWAFNNLVIVNEFPEDYKRD